MPDAKPARGFLGPHMPYNRVGSGPRVIVGCQGLFFDNQPLGRLRAAMVLRGLSAIGPERSIFMIARRQGLPEHSGTRDMAADLAAAIRQAFEPPVDVLGVSVGGFIAQWLAVDHPDVVRRLVLAHTGHRFGAAGAALQRRLVDLVAAGHHRAAAAESARVLWGDTGVKAALARRAFWLLGPWLVGAPRASTDYLIAARAALAHDTLDHLREIAVPTLVIGSDGDPLFPGEIVRRTAEGIPHAQCVMLQGARHGEFTAPFASAVREFLSKRTSFGCLIA
jgi:pimeloyl-ACP methyl ester carboxylesterase